MPAPKATSHRLPLACPPVAGQPLGAAFTLTAAVSHATRNMNTRFTDSQLHHVLPAFSLSFWGTAVPFSTGCTTGRSHQLHFLVPSPHTPEPLPAQGIGSSISYGFHFRLYLSKAGLIFRCWLAMRVSSWQKYLFKFVYPIFHQVVLAELQELFVNSEN